MATMRPEFWLWSFYGVWLFVVFPLAAWWGWSRDRKKQAEEQQ